MQALTARPALAIGHAVRTVLVGRDRVPTWLAGRPTWQRRLVVAAVVVGTVVGYPLVTGLAARSHPIGDGWAALIGIGEILPLALLVRFPLLGWRLGWIAALLAPLAPGDPWGSWPWDPPEIALLVLAFCVAGLRYGRPVLWTMWAFMLGLLWIWVPDPSNSVGGSLAFTALTALLAALASWWQARSALAEQRDRTQREQDRRAVLEDRARMARELHDVVAHQLSLIAVQSQTAPYRHQDVSPSVGTEFVAIGAMAREALIEMRRLLGVLRSEDPTDAPRAPQPGLTDLPELVDGARRAGVQVELSVVGPDIAVPATVGLCVYRVVQESLSNAGRHATGAPVAITLAVDPQRLQVRVQNGPSAIGEFADPAGPFGHGLAGMRERVALLGGSLAAGPEPDGGFAVVAGFPLGSSS